MSWRNQAYEMFESTGEFASDGGTEQFPCDARDGGE
jgi:hypothetical protein